MVAPVVWQFQSCPLIREQGYQFEAESFSLIFTLEAFPSRVNITESILVGSEANRYVILLTEYPLILPAPSPLPTEPRVLSEASACVVEAMMIAASRMINAFHVCVIFRSPNKTAWYRLARPNTHRNSSVIFGGLAVMVACATVDP